MPNKLILIFFSLFVLAAVIGLYIYTGMQAAKNIPAVVVEESVPVQESTLSAELSQEERARILEELGPPPETELSEEERTRLIEELGPPPETELSEAERARILQELQ